MTNNAQWVWDVKSVSEVSLEAMLDLGFEPFAVTLNGRGEPHFHLRRKVKK